jgi:hypothetical protein
VLDVISKSTLWKFGLLSLATCTAACGPVSDGPEGTVVLERADRPGIWRATYELATPTRELRFERPAAFYRERVWTVVTPGWEMAREGDEQVLASSSSASAGDRIVVEFPEYTDVLAKEYEFFQSFTDGSVAVYTGHLYVTPEQDADASGAAALRRVELVPGPDEHVVVRGEVRQDRFVWRDEAGDGTYAYFGAIRPLETDEMVAIVDPGAPPWLVEQMNAMLPELFATYTERFAEALPWKPVVIFNFEDVEMDGLSSGGGTLTGLVQMTAQGAGWHQATPESAEQLLYLIAHEAAHLWNGQLHAYKDPSDSWMHEGSADAFADLALEQAGRIDASRLTERRTDALNQCVSGLVPGALSESAARRQYRSYYACGNVIALWSAAAVSDSAESPERLFEIWRTLFERSGEDGRYDRETYFEALAELGARPAAVAALREFVDATHEDPVSAVSELMERVGVELQRLDRSMPELRRDRAATALRHVMARACDGRIGFYTEGRRFRTEPIEGCEPFASELRVVAIEGHEATAAGDLALAATADRCARGEPVELWLDDGGVVRVPCDVPPPPVPATLAFVETARAAAR